MKPEALPIKAKKEQVPEKLAERAADKPEKLKDLNYHIQEVKNYIDVEKLNLSEHTKDVVFNKAIEWILKGKTEEGKELLEKKQEIIKDGNVTPLTTEIIEDVIAAATLYQEEHEAAIREVLQPKKESPPAGGERVEELVEEAMATPEKGGITPERAVEETLVGGEAMAETLTSEGVGKEVVEETFTLEQIKEFKEELEEAKEFLIKNVKLLDQKLAQGGIKLGPVEEDLERERKAERKEPVKELTAAEHKEILEKIKNKFLDPRGFDLVIHGRDYGGKLVPMADLDAIGAVYLIDQSRAVERKKTMFVEKGEWRKGAINVDTGHRQGIVVKEEDKVVTVWLDHHGKKKRSPTSATELTYNALLKTDLIEQQEWIDKFAKFVTEIDNISYPIDKEYLKTKWWRSLYGLRKVLPATFIIEQFKKGRDPKVPFTEEEAKTTPFEYIKKKDGTAATLYDLSESTGKLMQKSIGGVSEALLRMKEDKIKPETKLVGKVLVNNVEKKNQNRIPLGFDVVHALGYDTQINLYKYNNGFFVSSKRDLWPLFKKVQKIFPGTKLIRGTMLYYQPPKGQKGKIDVGQLLGVLKLK